MADKKISALTSASTPLAGTEVLPIVQSGATVKVANNDLRPKQIQSNATSGVLQITGPGASSTRVATVPDANWTAARTDAGQTFTGNQVFTGTLLVNNAQSIAGAPVEVLGAVTGYTKSQSVTALGQTGQAYTTATPDGQTFTFNTASAKVFTISTGGGAAAIVFADYKSTLITFLANPSLEFEALSSPTPGNTGIFKSANSHTISIKNGTGSTVNYNILSLGIVTSTVDPA
jgi:hypothetical protein